MDLQQARNRPAHERIARQRCGGVHWGRRAARSVPVAPPRPVDRVARRPAFFQVVRRGLSDAEPQTPRNVRQ